MPHLARRSADRIWLAAFLLGVAALFLILHGGPSEPPGSILPISQRRPAPDFTLAAISGAPWQLSQHRGEVVLVNYWATWCGPCLQELPGLVAVASANPARVAVLGIALDTGRDADAVVRRFVASDGIPYPVAFPPPGQHPAELLGIPSTVLLDRHGRVARTYVGAVPRRTFERDVAALLAES